MEDKKHDGSEQLKELLPKVTVQQLTPGTILFIPQCDCEKYWNNTDFEIYVYGGKDRILKPTYPYKYDLRDTKEISIVLKTVSINGGII